MNLQAAVEHLREVDSEFVFILEKSGDLRLPSPEEPFESLINSIVSQQLSVKAAATIYQRVKLVLENDLRPSRVLETSEEAFRSAGLSRQKTNYLYSLANAFSSKPDDYDNLYDLTDEAVVQKLTAIKGIGLWTAQMFLMFTLLREDIFPIGDLGIRRGMENLLFKGQKQSYETLIKRAEIWSPYRSVASLYLWKAQD